MFLSFQIKPAINSYFHLRMPFLSLNFTHQCHIGTFFPQVHLLELGPHRHCGQHRRERKKETKLFQELIFSSTVAAEFVSVVRFSTSPSYCPPPLSCHHFMSINSNFFKNVCTFLSCACMRTPPPCLPSQSSTRSSTPSSLVYSLPSFSVFSPSSSY